MSLVKLTNLNFLNSLKTINKIGIGITTRSSTICPQFTIGQFKKPFYLNRIDFIRNHSNIKLIDKRIKNLNNSREKFYSSEVNKSSESLSAEQNAIKSEQQSLSIFKRFKEAYKQHGKVLIYCHITTCFGWIIGFFFLSKRFNSNFFFYYKLRDYFKFFFNSLFVYLGY